MRGRNKCLKRLLTKCSELTDICTTVCKYSVITNESRHLLLKLIITHLNTTIFSDFS